MLRAVEVDDPLTEREGADDLAGEPAQPPSEPGRHAAEVEQVLGAGELERGGDVVQRGGDAAKRAGGQESAAGVARNVGAPVVGQLGWQDHRLASLFSLGEEGGVLDEGLAVLVVKLGEGP
jgi:hypothetical protein